MEYLKVGQIRKRYPIIMEMGYPWLLKQIKAGRIEAINTSLDPKYPRYLIKSSEVERFIGTLQK